MTEDEQTTSEGMRRLYVGLVRRVRPNRRPEAGRGALGAFALVNGVVSLAAVSVAAAIVNEPLVFPSLGPTAYLLSVAPTARTTTPRNIVLGHAIGVIAGLISLSVFGLLHADTPFSQDMTLARAAAATLSLGLTAGAMTWFDAEHAPAGATTLIVSLGILTAPLELAALMGAVVFLAYQGVAINRLAGLAVPPWR